MSRLGLRERVRDRGVQMCTWAANRSQPSSHAQANDELMMTLTEADSKPVLRVHYRCLKESRVSHRSY